MSLLLRLFYVFSIFFKVQKNVAYVFSNSVSELALCCKMALGVFIALVSFHLAVNKSAL